MLKKSIEMKFLTGYEVKVSQPPRLSSCRDHQSPFGTENLLLLGPSAVCRNM